MIDYNSKKIDTELKFIISERSKRLFFIRGEINKYLNEDYDEEFYELIFGDWLDNLSNVSHLVWIDSINHQIEFKKNTINIPFNSYDFNVLRINKSFNSQLYYLKKNLLNLNFNNLNFDIFHSKQKKNNSIKEVILKKFKKLRNIFSSKEIFLYSSYFFGRGSSYFLKILKNNKIYFPEKIELSNIMQIDIFWRKNRIYHLNKIFDSYSFFKLLFFLYLPVSLLENLKENISICKKNLLKKTPKKIIAKSELHFNLEFKIQTYFYKSLGAKLVYIQHGGNYGLDNIHQFEKYEIKCSDKFVSWGWKYNYANVYPLSQPILNIENNKKIKKKTLLMMGNYPSFPYRLHFQPMGKLRVEKMRNETLSFLNKLGNYEDLYLKTYTDYDSDINHNLKKNFPNFKFENSKNITKIFENSRLVIHNYLCTSYLQTLALNIPTVCFYDPEVYRFKPEVDYYVKKFNEYKIFHQNGESAANFLKKTDIDDWWNNEKVQNIRKSFINKYSRFSNNWLDPWEI